MLHRIIFDIRYILALYIIGLLLALIPNAIIFVRDLFHYFAGSIDMTAEERTMSLFDMADTMMVAVFIVFLSQGSFYIFVKKLDIDESVKPKWLNKINPGSLKIKMTMSIIGIMSVKIMGSFMTADKISIQTISIQAGILVIMLMVCFVLTKVDTMLYGVHTDEHEHSTVPKENKESSSIH